MRQEVKDYIEEGNAVEVARGIYATQDSMYRNRLTEKDLEQYMIDEYGLSEIQNNKISDDKLMKLIPKMPKGYVGKNTGIKKYTISTPDGKDIILTQSKDKKNWSYEPSNVALKFWRESLKKAMSKNYSWNEETISYFQFTSSYISDEDLYEKIKEFVENDCAIEEGETEEDLVNDLYKKIKL